MAWKDIIKKNIGWRKNTIRELLDEYDELVATPDLDEKVKKEGSKFLIKPLQKIIKLCQADITEIKRLRKKD
tara:strand:+ start:7529 stop:7744 length:216 start_codon:yes stop_codon:yes gene_type:complete